MATLEKLAITNIRSFGDDEEHQIVPFDKPVTLILGENGCGKSTIIESLRFVTTGKEPYGKSVLVRDPCLTSTSTVKACVKLRLKNVKGEKVHLARGLQATRNRKTISQRLLDSTITIKKPGDEPPITISSRCVDTTGETLRSLGISKAILDNVIFCTQEDSFWPLETDKSVKEKFDQIFDSEKYNKCLNKVKDVRNTLKNKRGELEQNVEFNREKKTAANDKRKKVENVKKEIEFLHDELEEINKKQEPITNKLNEIASKEKELSDVHRSLETNKIAFKGFEREEKELRTRLGGHEFLGSNEELEIALTECNVQAKSAKELNIKLQSLKRQEKSLGDEIGEALGRIGELTKEVEINNGKIQEKKSIIEKLSSNIGIEASEEGIALYLEKQKEELTSMQREHESIEEADQSRVSRARDDVVSQEVEIKRIEKALQDNKNESIAIKKDLDSADQSQQRRAVLADELRKAESELASHQQGNDIERMLADLREFQNAMVISETKLTEAQREVKRLQTHAQHGEKLEFMRVEFSKKDSELRRLKNSHRDTLLEVLGVEPSNNFKQAVETRGDQLGLKSRDLRKQKAAKEEVKIGLKGSVTTLTTTLQKKKAELQTFEDQVDEVTNGAGLNETLGLTRKRVDDYQKMKGDLDASQHMYRTYIKRLRNPKPCCPLCSRDFAEEEEATLLADNLEKKLRDVPSRLRECETSLQSEQNFLRKLFDMETAQKKIDALKEIEVPALEKEIAEKKSALSQTVRELEEIDQILEQCERERESCTNMLGDMALIDEAIKALSRIDEIIKKIETLLPPGWSKDLLPQAQQSLEEISMERKKTEIQKDSTQKKINEYNEKLTYLQNKKHKLVEEELSLRSKEGNQKQFEDRLNALKVAEINLKAELEEAQAKLNPLKQAHNQLVVDLRQRKDLHKDVVKTKRAKLEEIDSLFKTIERLNRDISEFTRQGKGNKLAAIRADIAEREENLKRVKIQIENANAQLGDMAKIEVRRHNLEDTKALREKIKEKEVLNKKIQELTRRFGSYGYESLMQEKARLKSEENESIQRKANINGQIGALEAQKKSLEAELNSKMYKDIDKKFIEAVCQLKIADQQSQDLHRYSVAMDYAMGVYHKRAMERVNGYIREYWTKIYRGNDIDYIEIQTEQAEATEKRRSFNYKLVQYKADRPIDMRNRCSAGQKMLACLIVRMALAEVFSSNCGILTLDEPTTNLDRKNIRMLADALNELINAKNSMSNFQLVIITHDKDFLRLIINQHQVERFVEVSRNSDGRSQITLKNVGD